MKNIQISNETYKQVQFFLKQDGKQSDLAKAILETAQNLPSKVLIDIQPALNGESKFQKDWIDFYNKQEGEAKGKRMINAADSYQAGKSNSKELLQSLKKDFDESWIVSGTRILYNKDNLAGKVVHNYNSIVAKPIEIAVAEIPIYQPTSVKDVVEGKGLKYAQALFNTKDKANVIISTLEKLSQKDAEDIRFWTPDQSSRNNYHERTVRFGYFDGFHVGGFGNFDYDGGLSRGVLLNSEPKARSK